MSLRRKCAAECVGTFALVFAGCGAVLADQLTGGAVTHVGIALTFGFTIMVMVYATGHISGAHLNPAVTTAFGLTGHHPKKEIFPYIGAQCLGAVAASLLHLLIFTPVFQAKLPGAALNLGVTQPVDSSFLTAFSLEVVLTFFLMFVITSVATDARAQGAAAGWAIGGTVLLDALFGGPVTGGSMNPARSFGPALVSGNFNHFAAYVLGPVIGAILAVMTYDFIRGEQIKSEGKK